jgi:hypothetical protein
MFFFRFIYLSASRGHFAHREHVYRGASFIRALRMLRNTVVLNADAAM